MNRFRPLALTTFVLLRSVLLPAMDGKSGLLDPVLGGVTPSDLHEEVDSHAGEERHSVLEPVYEYMQLIPASHLQTDRTAIYPRIKKMADGRYILL